MAGKLTEDEIIGLRWMEKANLSGVGYLGPTTPPESHHAE